MGHLDLALERLRHARTTVGRALGRWLRWASTPGGLAAVFIAGLLIRLWLARGGGFPFDMASFAAWADRLAEQGPGGFYPTGGDEYFVDYPPGYLYVLYVLGKLSRAAVGGPPSTFLLKLPPILADLGVAWMGVLLARRLTPRTLARRFPVDGAVAVAMLLNPAIFFVSAVWGQVDSVQALLVLGAFVLLGTGSTGFPRTAAGLAVLAVAIGTKPQAAFVVPVAVAVLLWRHIRDGLEGTRGTSLGTRVLAVMGGVGRVLAGGLVAAVAGLALLAPFGLGPLEVFDFYSQAASTYQVTSVFAFNLWGAFGFWRPDSVPSQGAEVVRVLGIPALHVGLILFAIAALWLIVRIVIALSRGEVQGRVLLFGGAAVTLLAFAFLTRIHERYLFLVVCALAPFVAYRRFRWLFAVLSAFYLANVYFPYVYYLEFEGRSVVKIPGFDLLYGTTLDSLQMTLLSLAGAVLCVFVAWRGWRWLEVRTADEEGPGPPDEAGPGDRRTVPWEGEPRPEPASPRRWTLELHPVGRRGALLALIALVLVGASRLIGLGTPRGMYFDEVYHARTAGEYIEGREVYEWTHPPLAKELMAGSIVAFSGSGVTGVSPLPESGRGAVLAGAEDGLVWAFPTGPSSGSIRTGMVGDGCTLVPTGDPLSASASPTALAASGDAIVIGGTGREGPVVVRRVEGREVWRVPLPAEPTGVAVVGDRTFAVTADGGLHAVSADGEVDAVASGAEEIVSGEEVVWVTFPDAGEVVAYGRDAVEADAIRMDELSGGEVPARPGPIAAPPGAADRIMVADESGAPVVSLDVEGSSLAGSLEGIGADALVAVARSGLVWAVEGRDVNVIEPRGVSVIGTFSLPMEPGSVAADGASGTLVAAGDDELACAGGRPAFSWRFGSAIFGALAAAAAALLAVRLFGSVWAGALAAFFIGVDGLAFTISRIAMNDSYLVGFVLLAWFAALSALYHWGLAAPGRGERSRVRAIAWLGATGAFAGLAIASKWVGLYALGGIGLLFVWDAFRRREDGILSVAGGPVRTTALGLVIGLGIPLGVYVASYAPYFGLGHSLGELVELQRSMYSYHANLTASHPYGSPWYGWPVGHRAVFLFLSDEGARRSEIWTLANPVVFVGGLAAMIAVGRRVLDRRALAPGILLLGALVQYLPWILVSRVTFLYHYLPVVPFLALALGWWLTVGRERPDDPPGAASRRSSAPVWFVGGAALVAFVVLLPLLDGWAVPTAYIDAIKGAFTWMF